jgi:UTP--glucose-1-phosphate uridylyltransferase
MKVVIPCAGWGTRMYPVSKTLPKELLPIVNKPILTYVIEECIENNIEEYIIIVNPYKLYIYEQYFKNDFPDLKVKFVIQNEMTGWVDAMLLCEYYLKEPFALILPDNLFINDGSMLKKMIDMHKEKKCSVMAVSVPNGDPRKYGLVRHDNYKMLEFVEKPENPPSNLAHNGWDIFTPKLFDILRRMGKEEENKKATLAFNQLILEEGMYACEYNGDWLDTGNPKGFVNSFMKLVDRELLDSGN